MTTRVLGCGDARPGIREVQPATEERLLVDLPDVVDCGIGAYGAHARRGLDAQRHGFAHRFPGRGACEHAQTEGKAERRASGGETHVRNLLDRLSIRHSPPRPAA
jgi:hypothetical protein